MFTRTIRYHDWCENTTAIYYHSDVQKAIADAALKKLGESGKFQDPIAVQVVPFTPFFPAEDEHQSYYKKQPLQYSMYKRGSGRADFIHQNWENESGSKF